MEGDIGVKLITYFLYPLFVAACYYKSITARSNVWNKAICVYVHPFCTHNSCYHAMLHYAQ